MTELNRKRLSGVIACVGAVLCVVMFSKPPQVAPNGTIPSDGIGNALELLFVGAVIYLASMFILSRLTNQAED